MPGAGEAVSRRRGKVTFIQYRRKMLGFPGAGGSCVPAPGKLFPGAGERLAGLVCLIKKQLVVRVTFVPPAKKDA